MSESKTNQNKKQKRAYVHGVYYDCNMIVIASAKHAKARRLAMANVCCASNDWSLCHGEITALVGFKIR